VPPAGAPGATPADTSVPAGVNTSAPVGATGVGTPSSALPGVYEQDAPGSWTLTSEFASQTGITPKIVLYYSAWKEPFKTAFAQTALSHGAYVLVQLQPDGVTLSSIAAGQSDGYLRSYALAVREFGHPVILSFGHEMNGNWYSWGLGHASPSSFVAAWRHIVQIFREEGASNATWVWTVNSTNAANAPLQQWWPGAQWVNWVGIDGYYYRSTDSFESVFGETIAQIRTFSNAPVLIAETAVGVTYDRESQIDALLAGVHADHIVGVVWFDKGQNAGIYHQDWRLEDDPAAVAAFKSAAQTYLGQ
jgi:hypothetical protein